MTTIYRAAVKSPIETARDAIRRNIHGARERAYRMGAWQCPACIEGWWVYTINDDMHSCWRCGYQGGDAASYNKARGASA